MARCPEAGVIILPELPAERIDEDDDDLVGARIGPAEAIGRQQRSAARTRQQVFDRVGDVAEGVR
jgi:hypothetical protein